MDKVRLFTFSFSYLRLYLLLHQIVLAPEIVHLFLFVLMSFPENLCLESFMQFIYHFHLFFIIFRWKLLNFDHHLFNAFLKVYPQYFGTQTFSRALLTYLLDFLYFLSSTLRFHILSYFFQDHL